MTLDTVKSPMDIPKKTKKKNENSNLYPMNDIFNIKFTY